MTNQAETGGQAFPRSGSEHYYPSDGMTLLDYFAAKALQGFLANPKCRLWSGGTLTEVVGDAYEAAELMLEFRYE